MKKLFTVFVFAFGFVSCNNSIDSTAAKMDSTIKKTGDSLKAQVDTTIKKADSTLRDFADSANSRIRAADDSLKKRLKK